MKPLDGWVIVTELLDTGEPVRVAGYYPLLRRQRRRAENHVLLLQLAGHHAWVERA